MIAKRLVDLTLSGLGLLLLSPAFLCLSIFILIDSKGPVFFRQKRVGRNGKIFRIHKFRTMRQAVEVSNTQITIGHDSRITRVGYFLRRYKIDEFAQLIDVFTGSMSLIGPRPEVKEYVDLYPADLKSIVLSVRPGITDMSSIEFINEAELLGRQDNPEKYYADVIIPRKLDHYKRYVENRSFLGDIKILFNTIYSIFSKGRTGLVSELMN